MGRLYRNVHFLLISTLILLAVGVAASREQTDVSQQAAVPEDEIASAGY